MDPVVVDLIVNIAATAFYDATRNIVGSSKYSPEGHNEVVRAAVGSFAEVEKVRDDLGGDGLKAFLATPEVSTVIRKLYSVSPTRDEDTEVIRDQFFALWESQFAGIGTSRDEVDRLFGAIVAACDAQISEALSNAGFDLQEATASRRHNLLSDQIDNLQQELGALTNSKLAAKKDIESFIDRVNRQILDREGKITPQSIDGVTHVPIDDLYVPTTFRNEGEDPKSLKLDWFESQIHRNVVLGNPGSGKSTLAKKVAVDLARGQSMSYLRPRSLPIVVVLREYAAKGSEQLPISDYMAKDLALRYNVPVPEGAIEYLLSTGRALVVFDGLDELSATGLRQDVTARVQSFANLHTSVPIMVTSRRVGYGEAPLDSERFDMVNLADFQEEDVERYAKNWFSIGDSRDSAKLDEYVKSFMAEGEMVSDLQSNPLMLGLMCNLYKGTGSIPKNRPKVYEECANLLFNRWDGQRSIGEPLEIESMVEPAMRHLALWIYGDQELQAGVREEVMISEAASFLLENRFEKIEDAQFEARRFIEHCRGRAWVFTDTGSDASGERLYQFTHRTFLEYFAAVQLVQTHDGPEDLISYLEPFIENQEWDVVCQLAFQVSERSKYGSGNRLLNLLMAPLLEVGEVDVTDRKVRNRVSFAIRALAFLVPKPRTVRTLVSEGTRASITAVNKLLDDESRVGADELGGNSEINDCSGLITELGAAHPENKEPCSQGFREAIVGLLETDCSALAAETVLRLSNSSIWRIEILASAVEEILAEKATRIEEIGRTDWRVGQDLVWNGTLLSNEYIANFGLSKFLSSRDYRVDMNSERMCPGEAIFEFVVFGNTFKQWGGWIPDAVDAVRQACGDTKSPWVDGDAREWHSAGRIGEISAKRRPNMDDPNPKRDPLVGLYLGCIVYETALEFESKKEIDRFVRACSNAGVTTSLQADRLADLFAAKSDATGQTPLWLAQSKDLTEEQVAFFQGWLMGSVRTTSFSNRSGMSFRTTRR